MSNYSLTCNVDTDALVWLFNQILYFINEFLKIILSVSI